MNISASMNRLENLAGVTLMLAFMPAMAQRPYIMADQFGYRPGDEKVAVLADPVSGFNAGDQYMPGEILQVRRLDNNAVVFSGHPVPWNNGIMQETSGDRGWWFDFS